MLPSIALIPANITQFAQLQTFSNQEHRTKDRHDRHSILNTRHEIMEAAHSFTSTLITRRKTLQFSSPPNIPSIFKPHTPASALWLLLIMQYKSCGSRKNKSPEPTVQKTSQVLLPEARRQWHLTRQIEHEVGPDGLRLRSEVVVARVAPPESEDLRGRNSVWLYVLTVRTVCELCCGRNSNLRAGAPVQ